MTQQEFTIRTNYTPTENEFWAIHDAYVNSPYDKDTFCKVWKRQNAHRYITPVKMKFGTEEETENAVIRLTEKNANFRVVGRKMIYWYG